MDRMRQRMADTAVEADLTSPDPLRTAKPKVAPPEPSKPPAKPQDAPPPKPEATDELEGDEPTAPVEEPATEPEPKPEESKPGETKPEGKLKSPWKLLDQFKERLKAVEQENLALRAKVPDEKTAGTLTKRLEAAEKRAAELEDEIRYVSYAKSQEFVDKYQKPYEEAWTKANAELSELDVLSEDGTATRKATAQDLLALANMPLGEARKIANQMFGDAADDVMAHRRRVRELSDAQGKALEDARKSGAERQQQAQAMAKTLADEVSRHWQRFNAEDAEKYDFLKPKDEDGEWNERLEKATILVDKAFAESPHDPRLTAEQRAAIVRRHAAVRSRAIAYSSLKLENKRLRDQLAAKDKELAGFAASAPNGGNGKGKAAEQPQPANPMERAKQRLKASAVQVPAGLGAGYY